MKRKLYVMTASALLGIGAIGVVALCNAEGDGMNIISNVNATTTERSIKITADTISSIFKNGSTATSTSGTFSAGEIQWSVSNAYLDDNRIVIDGGEFYNVTKAAQDISIASGNKGTGFRRIVFENLIADGDFDVVATIGDGATATSETRAVTARTSEENATVTFTEDAKVTVAGFNLYDDEGYVEISFSSITYYYSCGTAS